MAPGTSGDNRHGTTVLSSIHDVDRNQWNNLVTQSDRGSLFHRHEWLAAVEEGMDHSPRHALVTKDSNPVALAPAFAASLDLPHGVADAVADALDVTVLLSGEPGYGGPVVSTNEAENVDRLFDALEATCQDRVLYHRIATHDLGNIRYGQYLSARGYDLSAEVALLVLNLGGTWEDVLAEMDKERRKAIRDAREQDYEVTVTELGEVLDRTYDAYRRNMERVGGNTFPRSFLAAVAHELGDRARVFTASVDGRDVGRYVYLLDSEQSVFVHWLSAIPAESCYESMPSELLHAAAIEWSIDEGFDAYSFDKTGAHFDNSVFRFKSKYGAEAVPLLHWEKGQNPLVWPLYEAARDRYRARELQEA
jgi:predicted N-acyltransferase